MGILANSVSICQFQVVGEFPAGDIFAWIGECLQKHAFRNIDDVSDELSIGWVRSDDYQSAEFAGTQPFRRDRYVSFTLRRDQRRIPAQLLKAYRQMAEQEFLNANPGFFRVPKQKREDIRDAVSRSLMAKTLPAPAMYDVVWDTGCGVVTFASLSAKTIDLFETEFKKSFPGLRLIMIHPFARALRVVPSRLTEELERANCASSEAVIDLIRSNTWIGEDFLLWLLNATMTGSCEFPVAIPGIFTAGERFTAFMNDRLLLQASGEAGVQKITVAGAQDSFLEVLAALRMGKRIKEATIHFEHDDNAWKLTLKGELFHFGSFRCPSVQLEKDNTVDKAAEQEAVFFERMHLLESGGQLFDSLFALFLEERLSERWPAKVAVLTEWIHGTAGEQL